MHKQGEDMQVFLADAGWTARWSHPICKAQHLVSLAFRARRFHLVYNGELSTRWPTMRGRLQKHLRARLSD